MGRILLAVASVFCLLVLIVAGVDRWAVASRRPGEDGGSTGGRRVEALPAKTGLRATQVTLDDLCRRFAEARAHNREHHVVEAVRKDLRSLSLEEILDLLARVKGAVCADDPLKDVESILVGEVYGRDRVLGMDYYLNTPPEEAEFWAFHMSLLFSDWAHHDVESFTQWIEGRRERLRLRDERLYLYAEAGVLLAALRANEGEGRMRLDRFSEADRRDIVTTTFRMNSYCLEPEEAVLFLRETLDGRDHEELVGSVCGWRVFHDGEEDSMRAFFERMEMSGREREAMVFEAAKMKAAMGGFNSKPEEFVERMRAFATSDAPGARARVTLAVVSEMAGNMVFSGKEAVDLLMQYEDVDDAAVRLFISSHPNLEEGLRSPLSEQLDDQ